VVRFLSAEWLAHLPAAPAGPADGSPAGLTVRHVVRGAPGGEATYEVRIAGGVPVLQRAGSRPADLTITCDYETAAGIVSGRLSAQAALAAGRVTLSGDLRVLGAVAAVGSGADPLPPELRAVTEVPQ
jgi:hypothetical protein